LSAAAEAAADSLPLDRGGLGWGCQRRQRAGDRHWCPQRKAGHDEWKAISARYRWGVDDDRRGWWRGRAV